MQPVQILHINYSSAYAPVLDNFIFEILDEYVQDMDCMRDDETRDIYLYFGTKEELEFANNLLLEKGKIPIENSGHNFCLLDLIRIYKQEKTEFQDEKMKLRQRIAKIYLKDLERQTL